MSGALIDTNMFVSFANKRDRDHQKARQIFERILSGEFGQPFHLRLCIRRSDHCDLDADSQHGKRRESQ